MKTVLKIIIGFLGIALVAAILMSASTGVAKAINGQDIHITELLSVVVVAAALGSLLVMLAYIVGELILGE